MNPRPTLALGALVIGAAPVAVGASLDQHLGGRVIVTSAIAFTGSLLVGMLLLLELGRRIGLRQLARDTEGARAGTGAVDGAVFALLGLLIAFTFSGAAARFDQRRQLIVEEANAIGTAWLRLDLLPAAAQPGLRELFRQYVDSRLASYRLLPDFEAVRSELARSTELQGAIWKQAVAAAPGTEGQRSSMLVLPALNQMFDIVTHRSMAVRTHPPAIIFLLLGLLALTSSLLAGFGMAGGKRRSWVHILVFSAIVALSVYVILDLEFPRMGLIRVDAADQLLEDVRRAMD